MMKRTMTALLALLLCLCMLFGALAEKGDAVAAPEEGAVAEVEASGDEKDEELIFEPVDEEPEEATDAKVWSEEIAEDAAAADAEAEAAEQARLEALKGSVAINATNFPDATFRSYVEGFDWDGDGWLDEDERADVTEIDVEYDGVTSLKGVKYFANVEYIYARNNELTSVDVSGLTRLTKLVLWYNSVSSLNVSGCRALEYLDVDDNQLSTLTANNLPNLETVWARRNGLTSVNVSGDTSLTYDGLHISENQPMKLNLSGCVAMTEIEISTSMELTALDVSGNSALTRLWAGQNSISSLTIKNCPSLNYLSVYDNYFTTLDITGCNRVKCGIDAGGHIDSDGDLDFTDCSGTYLYFDEGMRFTYNGSGYAYMVDGHRVGGVSPTKIYFTKKTVTLKMGKTLDLSRYLKLKPANACAELTWKSGKKSIATVDEEGVVTPVKPGTVKITVKTDNGKKATITVKVKAVKPTKVSIVAETKVVEVGKTIQLTAKLKPSNAYSKLTWTSGNKKIATVNKNGVVKGKKAGKVKITVKTANGKKASVTIKVKKKGSNPVKCRALLVAQCNYTAASALPGCAGDTRLMYNMLSNCQGGEGGSWEITKKQDLSYSGFFSAIDQAFAGADDNDVSLLFYSGHGASDGSLCSVPSCDLMSQSAIASKLQSIPGRFIIMYDSCHSGSGIYTYGEENSASIADPKAEAAFNAAVVNAFAAADTGILVDAKGNVAMDGVENTGELRVANKFYVLVAARKSEYSWCNSDHSYFTEWACEAVGTSGHMPADTNYNNVATLDEMFNYISDVGDDVSFSGYYQHVQAYPRNSDFKMFRR